MDRETDETKSPYAYAVEDYLALDFTPDGDAAQALMTGIAAEVPCEEINLSDTLGPMPPNMTPAMENWYQVKVAPKRGEALSALGRYFSDLSAAGQASGFILQMREGTLDDHLLGDKRKVYRDHAERFHVESQKIRETQAALDIARRRYDTRKDELGRDAKLLNKPLYFFVLTFLIFGSEAALNLESFEALPWATPAIAWGATACGSAFAAPLVFLEPYQTVQLEHDDRKKRLLRLSDALGVNAPQFMEYAIAPAEHGLKDYPTNIPVLRVIFQEKVFFDFNQDQMRPEAAPVLKIIAQSLALDPPDVTVFVAGHTDAIGSEAYNRQLGLRRARTVAAALAQTGVNRAQMFDVSFGKLVPIADNDSDEGRARNRRVEFLFGARPAPIAAWLVKQQTLPCSDTPQVTTQPCTLSPHIVAESVALAEPQKTVTANASVKALTPTTAPKTVTFGAKVVDLDMRQKVFSFRAPE